MFTLSEDQVDVKIGRDRHLDRIEKGAEVFAAVALAAFADDPAGVHVVGSEEIGRAMPAVVVRSALGHAGRHRQDRGSWLGRLDLRLLIDAEHERISWRRDVEPDYVADLVDEERVSRELEGLRDVRLESEVAPDTADGRLTHPGRSGHRA